MAVLNRDDTPSGKALAVADAVDLIDDWDFGVAWEQKIGVQRVRRGLVRVFDSAAGGDQRLTDHLAAENTLPARLGRASAKQIDFERFKIKEREEVVNGGGHRKLLGKNGAIGMSMVSDARAQTKSSH